MRRLIPAILLLSLTTLAVAEDKTSAEKPPLCGLVLPRSGVVALLGVRLTS